ncbi:MAG: exodeoxyribonuclease VII large subunit [Parcubacteria group bacterium]|nr:MAG: exodeoxyribonuclease VII large subunit [Parcubacteria group bacterium]
MDQDEKKLEPIFSVSEYIEYLNITLRKIGVAKITGEVTKLTIASSGHVYFSIKDKSGNGVLDCIIWKYNYSLCGVRLEEGKEVVLSGYPDIYPASGRFSFKADTVELKGEGALKKAYEELKNKLEKKGVFDLERKKKIPMFPERIGVITSRQGAVIHDFLNNIGKYGFKIQMIDSRVEGQEAIKDLLAAVRTFRKKNIDVLVVIRGGGSLESLQPFNNEALVKEILDFPVPVIAGIGHDKDAPLFTMAADASESTPTAVANLLNESWDQALLFLERYERDIIGRYEMILDDYKEIENKLKISFNNFKNALVSARTRLQVSLNKSLSGFKSLISAVSQRIEQAEKVVFFNNPERQLRLGYSIASCDGKIVRETKDVKVGKNIYIKVTDGEINSEVKNINKN